MWLEQWLRPPRHLLVVFLAITLVLAGALGWLSWRLIQQDRAVVSQRLQERLDSAADLAAAALLRKQSETEDRLASLAALPDADLSVAVTEDVERLTADALLVVFGPQKVEAFPRSRLLYYPFVPPREEADPSVFARGEVFEFQQKDYARALAAFGQVASSAKEPVTRAGALLRLGRVLRKANQPGAALDTYTQLAELGPASVGGLPAELVARHARCTLLDQLDRAAELEREAHSLWLDLHSGHWQLTRAAYRFYDQEARRWFAPGGAPSDDRVIGAQSALALAAGVDSLWEVWQRIRAGTGDPADQRNLEVNNRPLLLMWRSTAERLVALVAGPRYVEVEWLATTQPLLDQGVRLALADLQGRRLVGQWASTETQQALRISADTQLPWTLQVVLVDSGALTAQLAGRIRLLLLGLATTILIVLVGTYFTARAVTRELEVARLQSNFVSAVSHEFRTPLALLRQASELLADGRVSSEERRQGYYEALRRESDRLHRLVESLLDFGRMEAGAREYRFEQVEPAALVRGVAEEFAQEAAVRGYRVEVDADGTLPLVRADREALGRALWNLLDNAVKYSPGRTTVWVGVASANGQVAIRVRDEGIGIAPAEQGQIFKKFVRAASAESAGARGTGLGLAMVHHIVSAHGGKVHVDSRPGAGSTFTFLLPAARD